MEKQRKYLRWRHYLFQHHLGSSFQLIIRSQSTKDHRTKAYRNLFEGYQYLKNPLSLQTRVLRIIIQKIIVKTKNLFLMATASLCWIKIAILKGKWLHWLKLWLAIQCWSWLTRWVSNKTTELITISGAASIVIGTSALLKKNDILSVWDLLHGLMLPSGNDAAHCLAEYFGNLLLEKHTKPTISTFFMSEKGKHLNCNQTVFHKAYSPLDEETNGKPMSPPVVNSIFKSNPWVFRFIQEMNKNAKKIGMQNTNFDSPHGLSNKINLSTAYDMALLWMECVKIKDFNTITKWKLYQCNNRKK